MDLCSDEPGCLAFLARSGCIRMLLFGVPGLPMLVFKGEWGAVKIQPFDSGQRGGHMGFLSVSASNRYQEIMSQLRALCVTAQVK